MVEQVKVAKQKKAIANEATNKVLTQEQKIKHLELEQRTCRTENTKLVKNQEYYMDQIADLKKELCMMES